MDGKYTDFHYWKISGKESGLTSKPRISAAVGSEPRAVATGASSSLSKNQREKIQKRITDIESDIAKLEVEVASLSSEMSSPEIVADYTKLQKVTKKFREKEKFIQKLYGEWETATGELN